MIQYVVIENKTPSTFACRVVAVELKGTWKAQPKVYRTHKEAMRKMKSRHDTVCGKTHP